MRLRVIFVCDCQVTVVQFILFSALLLAVGMTDFIDLTLDIDQDDLLPRAKAKYHHPGKRKSVIIIQDETGYDRPPVTRPFGASPSRVVNRSSAKPVAILRPAISWLDSDVSTLLSEGGVFLTRRISAGRDRNSERATLGVHIEEEGVIRLEASKECRGVVLKGPRRLYQLRRRRGNCTQTSR